MIPPPPSPCLRQRKKKKAPDPTSKGKFNYRHPSAYGNLPGADQGVKRKREKKDHHISQHFGDLGKVVMSSPSTIRKEISIIGGVP